MRGEVQILKYLLGEISSKPYSSLSEQICKFDLRDSSHHIAPDDIWRVSLTGD